MYWDQVADPSLNRAEMHRFLFRGTSLWRLLLVGGYVSVILFVWVGLPAWTWFGWGKPLTESLLTRYAMPIGMAWHVLIVASALAAFRTRRMAALMLTLATCVLTVVGNDLLATAAMWHLEKQFAARGPSDFREPFRAIVMLGGCAARLASGRPEVNSAGQRVVTTAEFWHARKTLWIITTGGTSTEDLHSASAVGKAVLITLGVPGDRILQVSGGNTRDEIEALKYLLENPPAGLAESQGDIGLVTSAFHMPRAMRLARAAGLEMMPLPSGYRAYPIRWDPTHLVPCSDAIDAISLLLRERLAAIVGR